MGKLDGDRTPHKYANGRDLARVEVLALSEEIVSLMLKGYSVLSLFRMYKGHEKISDYSFSTFERAVKKIMEAKGYELKRNKIQLDAIMENCPPQAISAPAPTAEVTKKEKITIQPAAPDDWEPPRNVTIDG